jgi:curved DNA-binding protein CbpA
MTQFVRAQLDYYAVLEIGLSADATEINAAFRRLAWRYHPDRNPAPGATLQFQDINEAHQVLSDPERRAEYDAKWHPRANAQRRTVVPATRPHHHRSPHRRRRARAVLMAVCSVLFVCTAWVVIYAAISSPHFSTVNYAYDTPSVLNGDASQGCAFSMQMYPVNYVDQRGRQSTAWITDVRNCWGGATRVSSLLEVQPQRAARNSTRASNLY